ncbi:transposase [Xanthomonas oryzae pv. oryzicola]|nr:transposase [Xanthomonas oryzae pv. oryzicola]
MFFGKTLLHVQSPRGRELDSKPRCYSNSGGRRRGRDVEGVQILHRGQAKTLTRRQWRWIKRRQAVEPVIGHLKQDCRLNCCHLNGAQGDALHVLGCAAGDNLRWLLRWIACLRAWLQVVRARSSTPSSTMWPANMALEV